MIKLLLTAVLFFILTGAMAQNVGINNTDPKAALDLNGGLRTRVLLLSVAGVAVTIPANKSFIWLEGAPTASFDITIDASYTDGSRLVVYNGTSKEGFIPGSETVSPGKITELIFLDGEWRSIGTNNTTNQWNLTGNSGTDTAFNFIGTTDNKPLVFRINNERAGLIDRGENTALGRLSLPVATIDAAENTAIGSQTLRFLKDGTKNTAIGVQAAGSLKSGSLNVAVGQFALLTDTAGSETVAVGPYALAYNQNREGNTALGAYALVSNALTYTSAILPTQGLQNTAIGNSALYRNQRGTGSVAIGYKAAYSDTAANGQIAIGRAALYNSNGRADNLAIGDSALYKNGLGNSMLNHGTGNTAIGSKSLKNNTVGLNNLAIGNNALINNLNGGSNIAIGNRAMANNFDGADNVAFGLECLFSSNSFGNTAIGMRAMYENLRGVNNTAIGLGAGFSSKGSGNIFLGYSAGFSSISSNKLYIENSDADSLSALIYGDFAADSLLLNGKTVIKNNEVVRGYTKLGGYDADVPSIKMKKIPIAAGPAVNAVQSYPLGSGITDAKVVGIQVLMNYAGSWKIPPSYIDAAGYEYNVQVQNNNIVIVLKNGNSANIGGKPISVIVTYEE